MSIRYCGLKTTVEWEDGTFTESTLTDNDTFDQEKGILICVAKKQLGGMGAILEAYDMANEWLDVFAKANPPIIE